MILRQKTHMNEERGKMDELGNCNKNDGNMKTMRSDFDIGVFKFLMQSYSKLF